MRETITLIEGADDDRRAHALASEMLHAVIRHFMSDDKGGFWQGTYMGIGGDRYVIRFEGADLGWPEPYDTAIFALEGAPDIYDPTGYLTHMKSGCCVVVLKVNEDPARQLRDAVREIVHNQRAHNVLLHELIHMIDAVEGWRETEARSSYPKDRSSPEYWNHPMEFNAYFHNVSKRLNDFIARNEGSDSPQRTLRDADANGITEDFAETFKNAVEKLYVAQIKKFVTALRKHNHRRLLKRFYALHRIAAQIIADARSALAQREVPRFAAEGHEIARPGVIREGDVRAVQIAAVSPITRKPVFRILDTSGTDLGTIHSAATADEALALFRNRQVRRDQVAAEPVQPTASPPEKTRGTRPKRLPIQRVPLAGFSDIDEDDGYLYHVTTAANARAILAGGFQADAARMMSNYAAHSARRVFFTERAGVTYWAERVEAHAFHNTGREIKPAVLRIPRDALTDRLHPDPIGTKDARVGAYYIEGDWTV